MAIWFRAAAADNNPLSTQAAQISVPRPTGVIDGDFLLAAVAVAGGSGTSISSAPSGWNLQRRVDFGNTVSLAIYWKFAYGENSHGWTWGFSTANNHTAIVAAYTGVDSFYPIDCDNAVTLVSTSSLSTPIVTASLGNTLLVAAYATGGNDTFTQATTGYTDRKQNNQSTVSIDVADFILNTAGATTAASTTISVSAPGIGYALCLRPTVGMVSVNEVGQTIKAHFPPGADDLYDWENTATDIYKFFLAVAGWLKYYGFDYNDLLRQEFIPITSAVKLSDWEGLLGITQTTASVQNAQVATRQNAILGKIRESGGITLFNIRAAIAPLLGYATQQNLVVYECNRASLTASSSHTLTDTPQSTIPASTSAALTRSLKFTDGDFCSAAGAQMTVMITDTDPSQLNLILGSPTGSTVTFSCATSSAATSQVFYFYNKSTFAGLSCTGTWTLSITNTAGASATLNQWTLFVDGVTNGATTATSQLVGEAIFTWGVYADPALVGPNPDYVGSLNALNRIKPAFSVPYLIRNIAPNPDSSTTLPDACIPN